MKTVRNRKCKGKMNWKTLQKKWRIKIEKEFVRSKCLTHRGKGWGNMAFATTVETPRFKFFKSIIHI